MYQILRSSLILQKISESYFKWSPAFTCKVLLRFCSKGAKYGSPHHTNASAKALGPKEVVLYEYENSSFFNKLRMISLAQYLLWSLTGISSYDLISKLSARGDTGSLEAESERNFTQRVIICSLVLGTFLLAVMWLYMLRSVKKVVFKKDARVVLFETYTPFARTRQFSVPLQHVSGVISRHKAKGYIPLKIKNSIFYFLLDVQGDFKNPSYFDSTIAVKRDFKKMGE